MYEVRNPGIWNESPDKYFDTPLPKIRFKDKRFILTGIFAYAKREEIEKQIKSLGGLIARNPAKTGCYVVVGTLPTLEWATNDAGRKLLDALEMRDEGCFVYIFGEDYFIEELLKVQDNQDVNHPIASPQPFIPWEELVVQWFSPICAEFTNLRLTSYLTKKYLVVHPEGKKSKQICRIHYSGPGLPSAVEVEGVEDQIAFRKELPAEVLEKIRARVAEIA